MAPDHWLVVDAHQDLAWNMHLFGRDYTRSVLETRRREAGTDIPLHNDDTLLGWPDYQSGRIAVVFATIFIAPQHRKEAWETLYYTDENQAHALYRQQNELYDRLVEEHPDKFRRILNTRELSEVLAHWDRRELDINYPSSQVEAQDLGGAQCGNGHPVGLITLMEGAEGVRSVAELEDWWQWGVRVIGPAWAGTRFCGGTLEPGPLTKAGMELLDGMAATGFILDISHMDENATLPAIDHYPGRVIATHANCKALLKGVDSNRHLSDRVIRELITRQGVIGVVLYNKFLKPGWEQGDDRDLVSIQAVVDQIDYICQIAGDARHVGIGSDFDGGLGWQSVPREIDTVADLHKLDPLLAERGFGREDREAIFGGNWSRLLLESLAE